MTQRDACGLADPDDSWLRLITLLVLAVVVLAWDSVAPGLLWFWRVFLPEVIFCVVFSIMVAPVVIAYGYRG